MKPSLQRVVILAVAGAVGFALGALGWFQSAPKHTAGPDAEERSADPRSALSAGASKAAAFGSAGARETFDRMAAAVQNGNREQVLDALEIAFSDPTLPPVPTAVYRDALLERLGDVGGIREFLESSHFPASERPAVLGALVRSLAKKDAASAETFVHGVRAEDRAVAHRELMRAFGELDPKRGLTFLEKNPKLSQDTSALYSEWAERDPEAAATSALSSKTWGYGSGIHTVMSVWAGRDADAVKKWIETRPENERKSLERACFSGLASTDPKRALEELAARPELADESQAQLLGMNLATSVEEADEALNRLPPGQTRTRLISGMAQSLAENPEAALAWLDTLLPGEKEAAIGELFQGIGLQDPKGAFELASAKLEGAQRQQAILSIIGTWAQFDSDAAFEAITTKLDKENLASALSAFFSENSREGNLSSQLEQASKLGPENHRAVLRALGRGWGFRGGRDIPEEILSLGAEQKSAFAEGVLNRPPRLSAEQMTRLAAMIPLDRQGQYAEAIARPLAQADLSSAARFLASLPEGARRDTRSSAMNAVMEDWAYLDPGAATTFVDGLPPGSARDMAAQALAGQMRNFDLDGATRLAAGITKQAARNAVIEQLSRDWARVDAARGREFMTPLLKTDEDRRRAKALFGNP
jgi:hypothetical protein